MIWLSVLVASLLFFATLIAWQSLKKKLKKPNNITMENNHVTVLNIDLNAVDFNLNYWL